jgi:hypothetical protein
VSIMRVAATAATIETFVSMCFSPGRNDVGAIRERVWHAMFEMVMACIADRLRL